METPHYAQRNGLPWATLDLHCHTTLSDGKATARELVAAAAAKGPENGGHMALLAVTDHDAVNDEAVALATEAGIPACPAAEISACDYEGGRRSLHLTYYAREIGRRTRDVLAGIRSAREGKIRQQCALLASHGFSIAFADMRAEAGRRGMGTDCLNNLDLARVALAKPGNAARARAILDGAAREGAQGVFAEADRDPARFLRTFLKRDAPLAHVGCASVPDYEPSVEECGRLAREEGALLAVAHPNFTFEHAGVGEFLARLKRYAELGVNAVELNAAADGPGARGTLGNGPLPQEWPDDVPGMAGRSWENAVRWGAREHGLWVTYGSDWHGDADGRHAGLGDLHPSFYAGDDRREPRCAPHAVNEYRTRFAHLIGAL